MDRNRPARECHCQRHGRGSQAPRRAPRHATESGMIVCSCNVISDHDIRDAVVATDNAPFSAAQVYDCLGCTVRCGRCSQSVRRILDEQAPRSACRAIL
ncbi:(2Fe-2S)-binding protein [Bradyrhizobium guangdongense]